MTQLLTDSQMNAIRKIGESAMTKTVTIRKVGRTYSADSGNPFGDDDLTVAPSYEDTVTKAWIISVMGRSFDVDGGRSVAVHDLTMRVPIGTDIEHRDIVIIDGVEWVCTEANPEDTWNEWVEAYLKRVA